MHKFTFPIYFILFFYMDAFCQDSTFFKIEMAKIDSIKDSKSSEQFKETDVHGESEFFGYYEGVVFFNNKNEIEKVSISYNSTKDNFEIFCNKNQIILISIHEKKYYCIDKKLYDSSFHIQQYIELTMYSRLLRELSNLFSFD